ncbi:ANTAR domain-containing protein [Pantoea sp. 18069]|uniref:type IV pili methyl-accepting chemotaxis transducer N-terminal domain-containing protein n=1 Tax=Pantoea sp. 18069 TaxID=2681415 RepID=UPI001359EB04|nr:ANTAR domain-containing protein [Pantoea sp. 18069]
MNTFLFLYSNDSPWPQAWRDQFAAHGMAFEAQAIDAAQLVQRIGSGAPLQVVVAMPATQLSAALAAWPDGPPCAISLIDAAPAPALLERLQARGLAGWWPQTSTAQDLAAGLALDRWRWEERKALRVALASAQSQLADRKWLERAKGIVADARGTSEDEAFTFLRNAAMHASLKLSDISRSVVETAFWAESLNQAGQLRMLSQRIVRLAAQSLLGVDRPRARALQTASIERVQARLHFLQTVPHTHPHTPAVQSALAVVVDAWSRMQQVLAEKTSMEMLARLNARAEHLLQHAEALVQALEAASGRRALTVINLCGRQRMLVQRLGKTALLGELLQDASLRALLADMRSEVEVALLKMEMTPLSSPEITLSLRESRKAWLHLQSGLTQLDSVQSRAALCRSCDSLHDNFDQLTLLYEKSLQLLMS